MDQKENLVESVELSTPVPSNGVETNGVNGDVTIKTGAETVFLPEVKHKLKELIKNGKLLEDDINQELGKDLSDLPLNAALSILGKFESKEIEQGVDKLEVLRSILKTYSPKFTIQTDPNQPKGPDAEKIKEISERLGLHPHLTAGQRKYEVSPETSPEPSPHSGSEILIRNIPQHIYEDELIPLVEDCGTIWSIRLMVDAKSRLTKGFAFVLFTTKEAAENAVAKLDKLEIVKGKDLKVSILVPKLRLFVGSIPKYKTKEEIQTELSQIMPGIVDVIIQGNGNPNHKNRGYCFLEFDSHKSASDVLKKQERDKLVAWNRQLVIDWAKPQKECDEESMSKVKELFVKNVPADVTEEKLKEMFETYGTIKQVRKLKDYAFIHYKERDAALKAIEDYTANKPDAAIAVSLAKPIDKKKEIERKREKRVLLPSNGLYAPSYPPMYFGPQPPNQSWSSGYGNFPGYYGNGGPRATNENYGFPGQNPWYNYNYQSQTSFHPQMQYRGYSNDNYKGFGNKFRTSNRFPKKEHLQSNNNVDQPKSPESVPAKEQPKENGDSKVPEVESLKSL